MECQRCPMRPVLDAFFKTNNLAALTDPSAKRASSVRLRPLALQVESALRNVCLACTAASDDDNPTNRGQTIVSMDAPIADSNASVSDYLVTHRIDLLNSPSPNDNSHSVTNLPESVEDTLRQQIASFASLSFMDLCLVAHLLNGGSLASFASMTWMDSVSINPKSGRPSPISRQAVHSRFKSICRRIPTLAAISSSVFKPLPTSTKSLPKPLPSKPARRRTVRLSVNQLSFLDQL